MLKTIEKQDTRLYHYLIAEQKRQDQQLNLIASENLVSKAILEASSSVLTNKYAEGYPSKRYYGGCQIADKVEQLAIDRAKGLFSCSYANVQPHSGSQANMAVFSALLEPCDRLMGMDLAHGGHLTHGSPVNFSGKFYEVCSYTVDPKTHLLDYEEVRRLAKRWRPKLLICGASSYARTIDFVAMASIAAEVESFLLADIAHISGLVAAGLHPSPLPFADVVTSTTHKTLRGPRGGLILMQREPKDIAVAWEKKLDSAIFPGIQGGPCMHTIAGKALCFHEAGQKDFYLYQQQVLLNAKALAKTLLNKGLGVLTGGTDNHIVIVNLQELDISGKEAQAWLESVGIIVNKNMIPFDKRSPWQTSGLRLGTPVLSTRGFKESHCEALGVALADVVLSKGSQGSLEAARKVVQKLSRAFPLANLGYCA